MTTLSSTYAMSSSNLSELSRLISAAVVNKRFCELLLQNPRSAISNGYAGETFRLGHKQQEAINAIQASTLADFASQLQQSQF